MTAAASALPLNGLRVLDLTRLLPGPVAGLRLAELGADVLKIEDPGAGDYARTMLRSSADTASDAPSAFYRIVNRGKRQQRIDLKSAAGRAELGELVSHADVLLESFRPGVMARLGVGYDTLHARNPKLVYCAITGYGSHGPFARRAGHDINYIGYAGVLDQLRTPDGELIVPNFQIADLLGGALSAVTQVLAALWQVARGGNGCCVDVSMTRESYVNNIVAQIGVANHGEAPRAGTDLLNGGVPCYGVYATLDKRWMAVGALELKFWQALCGALGRPDWRDRHWSLGQAIGGPEARAIQAELAGIFSTRTQAQWSALFDPVDCCVSPVLSAAEAAAHVLLR